MLKPKRCERHKTPLPQRLPEASIRVEYDEAIAAFEKQFSRENWKQVCDRIPAITHEYGRKVLGLKLG